MADIFRAATIARLQPSRAKAASFDAPNILLSVLVAVAPFQQEIEFSAPKQPGQVHREFDPPVLLANTLKPAVVALPFPSGIWESPFPQKAKVASFDPPNLLLSEFVATQPFFEPLWPNAVLAKPKAATFDPPNPSLSTLQAVFPIQNWQWERASPRRAKALSSDPPNLPLATLKATSPFQPIDWARPHRLRAKVATYDPPYPFAPPAAPVAPTTCYEAVMSAMSAGPVSVLGLMSTVSVGASGPGIGTLPLMGIMSNTVVAVEADLC